MTFILMMVLSSHVHAEGGAAFSGQANTNQVHQSSQSGFLSRLGKPGFLSQLPKLGSLPRLGKPGFLSQLPKLGSLPRLGKPGFLSQLPKLGSLPQLTQPRLWLKRLNAQTFGRHRIRRIENVLKTNAVNAQLKLDPERSGVKVSQTKTGIEVKVGLAASRMSYERLFRKIVPQVLLSDAKMKRHQWFDRARYEANQIRVAHLFDSQGNPNLPQDNPSSPASNTLPGGNNQGMTSASILEPVITARKYGNDILEYAEKMADETITFGSRAFAKPDPHALGKLKTPEQKIERIKQVLGDNNIFVEITTVPKMKGYFLTQTDTGLRVTLGEKTAKMGYKKLFRTIVPDILRSDANLTAKLWFFQEKTAEEHLQNNQHKDFKNSKGRKIDAQRLLRDWRSMSRKAAIENWNLRSELAALVKKSGSSQVPAYPPNIENQQTKWQKITSQVKSNVKNLKKITRKVEAAIDPKGLVRSKVRRTLAPLTKALNRRRIERRVLLHIEESSKWRDLQLENRETERMVNHFHHFERLAKKLTPDPSQKRRSTISPTEAQNIFNEMKKQRLGFRYPDEHCVTRAYIAVAAMARAGFKAYKVQVYGDLWVKAKDLPSGKVSWTHHIAPAIKVMDSNGKRVEYILDPSVADKPITRPEWLHLIHAGRDAVVYRVAGHKTTTKDPSKEWSQETMAWQLTYANIARKKEKRRLNAPWRAKYLKSKSTPPGSRRAVP